MDKVAPVSKVTLIKYEGSDASRREDLVVTEEPLEIRIRWGLQHQRAEKSLSVTMRTPGHDFELTAGFLFTEGILSRPSDLKQIRYCLQVKSEQEKGNVVIAELSSESDWEPSRLDRHFYAASSCGVCGKSSIEAVHARNICTLQAAPLPDPDLIHALAGKVDSGQGLFRHTGGLHAAALFSPRGELLCVREDVGRHNAVDKVIGARFAMDHVPLHQHILWVSGRAGFEIVQKAIVAGISTLVCVGAPSSLSVETARNFGLHLIGFARNHTFNLYQ